jgi:DUF1680 family protein
MLAWRLLLATGDPVCADVIDRTIFNGVLPGVSLDGTSFFYVNTLQRRTDRAQAEPHDGERKAWFPCACCPPNLMRMLSSWSQYVATSDADGVQIHQYATAEIQAAPDAGGVRIRTETAYPWKGRTTVTVVETPDRPWSLSLRIPGWAGTACVRLDGGDERIVPAGSPWSSGARQWRAGETVLLDVEMPARVTAPQPRVDAVRGCLAIERGPLVYCVESVDLPAGVELEDVAIDPAAQPAEEPRPEISDSLIGLTIPAGDGTTPGVRAVPYFAWANRSVEAMRVWIPQRGPRNEGGPVVDDRA